MTTTSPSTLHLTPALRRALTKRARAAQADPAEFARAALERGLAVRDIALAMQASITDAVTPLRADIDRLRAVMRELLGEAHAAASTPSSKQKGSGAANHQNDDAKWDAFLDLVKNPHPGKKGAKQ